MNKLSRQFYLFIIFILAYLGLTFLATPNSSILTTYNLSLIHYRLLMITVAAPLILIWLAAFYGYAKLHGYVSHIKNNKDGKHIKSITFGIMVLVFQLPFVSFAAGLLNHLALKSPSFVPTATIASHYISLIFPLVAFWFIGVGARGLSEIVKRRPSLRGTYVLCGLFIVIGTIFTYLIFKGLIRQPAESAFQTRYYLPDWLLLLTLVVPYIFTWFVGALAAYEMYLYGNTTPGILYRRGWNWLAMGIGWIIFMSIALQYLTALMNRVTNLQFSALLIMVYCILLLMAVGYVLLAWGAKRLERLEVV